MSKTSNNDTKATFPNASTDKTCVIIPDISNDRDRKVTPASTEDELLAAQGLLELSREIRIFPTDTVSAFKTITQKLSFMIKS